MRNEKNSFDVHMYIELAKQGNQDAFETILNHYSGLIYYWVKNIIEVSGYKTRYSDEIEDLLQIARTVFSECLYAYKPSQDFVTFAHSCVYNGVRNHTRKSCTNKGTINHRALCLDNKIKDEDDLCYADLVQNNQPEYEGTYCLDDNNPNVIFEMIEKEFGLEYRKICELKYQGYKYDEIGEKLQISEKKVGYRVKKIKKFYDDTLTKKK